MPHATEPRSTSTLKAANRYFTSLPLKPQCLNFRANMGISATSIQELKRIPSNSNGMNHEYCSNSGPKPTISEPQKRALAGVGSPMNDVVCRVSMLKLARRRAEKAATKYAK